MKVLFVGFYKTGTRTINEALGILGYKLSDLARNQEFRNIWWKFHEGNGTPEDIKMMFEGYDATGDSPCFIYWKDFLKAYPDIKLILTTRKVEDWIESFNNQVSLINKSDLRFPLSLFSRRARDYFQFAIANVCKALKQPRISSTSMICSFPLHGAEILKCGFERHIEDVKKNAPPDQLLVYNVKEGWEPLCRFLGKEVPDVPFPHMNKRGKIITWRLNNCEFMLQMYREMYFNISVMVAIVSAVIFGVYLLWKYIH